MARYAVVWRTDVEVRVEVEADDPHEAADLAEYPDVSSVPLADLFFGEWQIADDHEAELVE